MIDNGIPVVYLNIDETDTTIEEMNASVDHSVYCYGTISIKVPEGFHYSDYPDTDLERIEAVSMSIRGRGNSSWRGASKKPYKIKLDDKKQVLGMAENKHWALIANAKDPTLLRDRITGWLDEDGNIITSNIKVNKDMTIIAKYVSDDTMSHAKDIAFNKDSDVINYSSFRKVYQIPYTLIPADADDQNIRWTSSDINIATVNEEGTVYYTNPGTVKLTGSLRLGRTRTFTLTILPSGSSLPGPKKIYPESKEIKLKVNEQSPFMIRTDPDPSKINEYEYSSDNDEIASIDENGVITAHKPGQVKVYVKIKAVNQEYEEYYLDTYTTVSVSALDPEPSPAPKPAPEEKSSPKEYRLPLTGIE